MDGWMVGWMDGCLDGYGWIGGAQTTAEILCRSYHAEALPATMSEGFAHGPYVATRVEFESATFREQGTEPTTAPPCPTRIAMFEWVDGWINV